VFGSRWGQASLYAELGSLYLKTGQGKLATVWLEKSAAVWHDMTVPGPLDAQRKNAMAAVEHDLAIANRKPSKVGSERPTGGTMRAWQPTPIWLLVTNSSVEALSVTSGGDEIVMRHLLAGLL